jgi:NDP-sugar pyrophosphorylase family protein
MINKVINVVIPAAGAGSRFQDAGYKLPKPLITVKGKPLISLAVESINIKANYIYLVQKSHCDRFSMRARLEQITPGCIVLETEGLTQGAACTVLLAKNYINNDAPLLVANCDHLIEWDSSGFLDLMEREQLHGGILTFNDTHPKYSYCGISPEGLVTRVVEKDPISDIATAGIYYWSKGQYFVESAEKMISNNDRVNNEFYVAPTYNYMIEQGMHIKPFLVSKMVGLGTPEDLARYLKSISSEGSESDYLEIRVGDRIKVGQESSKLVQLAEGTILEIVENLKPVDNSLYPEVSIIPSIWDEEKKELLAVSQVFGEQLEKFLDSTLIKESSDKENF